MNIKQNLINEIKKEVGQQIIKESIENQNKINKKMIEHLNNFEKQAKKSFQEFLTEKWEEFIKKHKP